MEATPFHLHHYAGKAGRGGATFVIERVWPRAVKHEAFSQTTEANSLQFPLKTGVVPSNNLEIG